MFNYVIKRLLISIPTLFVIITLSFFMIRFAPGGPFDQDRKLPPEVQANINKAYHLDEPLVKQYARYMSGLLKGDLGPSFQYQDKTVNEVIGYGAPISFKIGMSALIIALAIGLSLGIIAALRKNSWVDYFVMSTAMIGVVLPSFVLAPILILLFAVHLGVLPAGGWGDSLKQIILPVTVMALPMISALARLMRGSMIEVLHSNHVRTARAKGLTEFKIIIKHCLKPAMMPIVSVLGPAIAGIVTGSLIIEQVFGLPGIGRYFVNGALNRDYTLVLGVVIFYGVLITFFNLLVDLAYGYLDPKVRIQK